MKYVTLAIGLICYSTGLNAAGPYLMELNDQVIKRFRKPFDEQQQCEQHFLNTYNEDLPWPMPEACLDVYVNKYNINTRENYPNCTIYPTTINVTINQEIKPIERVLLCACNAGPMAANYESNRDQFNNTRSFFVCTASKQTVSYFVLICPFESTYSLVDDYWELF